MGRLIRWLIILALLGAGGFYGFKRFAAAREQSDQPQYNTVPLRRGSLVASRPAMGTIEPEDLIDVGAQVAGRIVEFGKDTKGQLIDYGSEVKAGMVLAKIDPSVYQASVQQAEAAVSSAKANVNRAKADIEQFKAKYNQAQRDWERAQRLGPSDALARSSYDAYQSGFEAAKSNLEVGKAAIQQAEAGVVQAQADLDRARQNLSYCTISSPVDGIVIDRRVNIGQTVVASLNAPSLFLLAKDLKRVQVWIAVNEADIGQIRPGQTVTFTCETFPNEKFEGKVGKIRLNASMSQNVVTYTVEVETDNSNGKLLPYLTVNAKFETGRVEDALLVPNAALRWEPPPENPQSQGVTGGGQAGGPAGRQTGGGQTGERRGPRRNSGNQGNSEKRDQEKRDNEKVWILESGQPRPVQVDAGISDGLETVITGPGLKEGTQVVIGIRGPEAQAGGGTNPFVPQLRWGRRR